MPTNPGAVANGLSAVHLDVAGICERSGRSYATALAFAVLAMRWTLSAARGRILNAGILSLSALTIGFPGPTHLHLTWTAWADG